MKRYIAPQLTIIPIAAESLFAAGTGNPTPDKFYIGQNSSPQSGVSADSKQQQFGSGLWNNMVDDNK